MIFKKKVCQAVLLLCGLLQLSWAGLGLADDEIEFPVLGKVTFVDFGAETCIPCRLMEPIIDDLKAEYRGKVAVIFVDVSEQRELARGYSIRTIPTQVFFDKHGVEAGRHEGFLAKDRIVHALKQLGVD